MPNEYISIHRKLFQDIFSHAGKIREYNITKNEWVLDGDTIVYGSASELMATLAYDFSQEKPFDYRGFSMDEIIHIFLRNLLLNEKHELHNRTMHISGKWKEENLDIEIKKPDIEIEKPDIEIEKPDIEKIINEKAAGLSFKTKEHIRNIFEEVGFEDTFGRQVVMEITGLKAATASELIKKLKTLEIIENVSGFGKGKYKFSNR